MGSRRKFTKEFKLDAVQRLRAGEPAGLVARSLAVRRPALYRWSRDVDKFGERAFPGVGPPRAAGAAMERRGGSGRGPAGAKSGRRRRGARSGNGRAGSRGGKARV